MSHVLFGSSSFVQLRDGSSILGLAERARRAGAAFTNGVGAGWAAGDVQAWLAGPYRAAVHVTPDVGRDDGAFDACPARLTESPATSCSRANLHGSLLAQELRAARDAAVSLVKVLARVPARVPFVEEAICAGLVTPCSVGDAIGWIPAWTPGAGAGQLVGALFAADFLVRPKDYRDLLLICPMCDALLFDIESRARGRCAIHAVRPCSVTHLTPRIGVLRANRPGVTMSRT